ncbi:hypothetical protein FGO68_gene8398 [Halteria grandinella]|uniref:Uncharacterized protein n=1 Tax=Halteria grandinella TaxID=5974 RepID=A0A8J8P1Y0_HALGN|nr:hypothetical protein FGO68_gene8398 [Halteria grandinella]
MRLFQKESLINGQIYAPHFLLLVEFQILGRFCSFSWSGLISFKNRKPIFSSKRLRLISFSFSRLYLTNVYPRIYLNPAATGASSGLLSRVESASEVQSSMILVYSRRLSYVNSSSVVPSFFLCLSTFSDG